MRKESESITFRIQVSLLKSLRTESFENHISVNTLVNQLIIEHEKWHKYARHVGFISIPKDFQRTLLDNITKNKLIEITQKKAENCKDIITMLRPSYDLNSFLDVIETWFMISGFSCRKDENADIIKLNIHHDMGEKWSVFISILLQQNLEKLINGKILVEMTDKTVIVVLPKNQSVIIC